MENTWILFQMKNEVVFKKSGMKWRGSFYKKEPEMASKGLNSCNSWESTISVITTSKIYFTKEFALNIALSRISSLY